MEEALAAQKEKAIPAGQFDALPPLDTLAIEVGYGLIPLVDADQNGELLERIKSIRRQMASEIGIVVPPVHIQDNMQLKPGQYSILLKGNEIAGGDLMTNYHLIRAGALHRPLGPCVRLPSAGREMPADPADAVTATCT